MRKVNLQVIRPWVAKKVVELVGFEDEVLIEYAMGLLEDKSQPVNNFPCFPTNASIDIVFRHQILKKCKSTLLVFSPIPPLRSWSPFGTY
jgi:hypothetical protein